ADDDGQAELPQILDMAGEICYATLHRIDILRAKRIACDAAVHLQRADGRHHHCAGRLEASCSAFDVEEFLRTKIGAKSGLGHDDVGELEAEPGGHDGVAAVRDV